MNISFYTIDDLSLGYDPKGVTGYRLSQFLCLEDALLHYRGLSASKQKALGLTDGTHVLPLVECCRLFSTDHEGEDVLASDFRMLPLWAELPEAAEAEHICITELRLRYVIRALSWSRPRPRRNCPSSTRTSICGCPMEAVTCLPSAGSMPLAEAGVLFPSWMVRRTFAP